MENDFSIIDKLVEFGAEAPFASRMTSTINDVLSEMKVPGSMADSDSGNRSHKGLWYVSIDGKPVGPLDEKEIITCLNDKKIDRDSLAWSLGMSGWKRIDEIPDIMKLVNNLPPEL